ncbi:MAG TPA: hypothetical protein VEU62_09825 [Bryobacterales bacterium]|nr:hypothetical protein [Bryobacterales bacterium]
MSAAIPSLDELNAQAQSALAAGEKATAAVQRDRLLQWLGHTLWAFTRRYWAILYIVERAVASGGFDRDSFHMLHEKVLPLERMADNILASARTRDYLNVTLTAAPLLSLQECNEHIKDCMAALESMLEPHLDDLMAEALDEHRRGETIPLDSIS